MVLRLHKKPQRVRLGPVVISLSYGLADRKLSNKNVVGQTPRFGSLAT